MKTVDQAVLAYKVTGKIPDDYPERPFLQLVAIFDMCCDRTIPVERRRELVKGTESLVHQICDHRDVINAIKERGN